MAGLKIKDAPLIENISGNEAIPVSNSSGKPYAVLLNKIKNWLSVTFASKQDLDDKQDNIEDLSTIRSNAQKGSTAVQPNDLSKVATSGSYNDLKDKPTIGSTIDESTIAGWGFTKNTGNYNKPSSGIPKTDLDVSVQTSLLKAEQAITSIPLEYITEIELSSKGFATESWVNSKGYLTSVPSEYITESELKNKIWDIDINGAAKALATINSNAGELVTKNHHSGLLFENSIPNTEMPWATGYNNAIISLSRLVDTNNYITQLGFGGNGMYYRSFTDQAPTKDATWKTFAFLDSNVASADKLATSRNIWGQSFDGTGNIEGKFTNNVPIGIYGYSDNAFFASGEVEAGDVVNINFGKTSAGSYNSGYIGHLHKGDGYSNNGLTFGGTNADRLMQILYNGNVGIGTIEPIYKLDVDGETRTTLNHYIGQAVSISNLNPYGLLIGSNDFYTYIARTEGGTWKKDVFNFYPNGDNYAYGKFVFDEQAELNKGIKIGDVNITWNASSSSVIVDGSGTIKASNNVKNQLCTYPKVSHGSNDTTFELTPNTFHVWGEVASLTLSLGAEIPDVTNEYVVEFVSGNTAAELSLPDTIKWMNGENPTISSNKTYQLSIMDGLGVILEF